MKAAWVITFLVLASIAGALLLPGCASTPDKLASALPPMPPLPRVSLVRSSASTVMLARNSVLPALPDVNDWGNMLAFGMGDTWQATNGGYLIGEHVRAHRWMVLLIEGKAESPLIPQGKYWLMTTNQAKEFLQVADKLRKEENLAVYAPGAE